MTPQNLALNVHAEAERGDLALLAAEKLLEAQLWYDAASRAYYATFHYARALCLSAGHEPRSHRGVGHLLNVHFVRTGILPASTSRLYASLQKYREASDYDVAFVLDEEGANEALAHARQLIGLAREQLDAKGLI